MYLTGEHKKKKKKKTMLIVCPRSTFLLVETPNDMAKSV